MTHTKQVEKASVGNGWVNAAAKQPTITQNLLAENELLRAALRFYASGGLDKGSRAHATLKVHQRHEEAHHFAVTGEYSANLTAQECEVLRAIMEASSAVWKETVQP